MIKKEKTNRILITSLLTEISSASQNHSVFADDATLGLKTSLLNC